MWRIVVITLPLLIICASLSILLLIRIKLRQMAIPTPLPEIRYNLISPPPSATPLPTSGDEYSLARLVRGRVLDYDPKTKKLSVIREALTAKGQAETYPIALTLQGLQEVTCWTDPIQTVEGQSVSITRAFFPLEAHSKLYLAGERTVEMLAVLGYLAQQRPYVLALLETTTLSEKAHPITQLVVVNCP